MYQPAFFREDRLEVLHSLVADHPLGLLVTRTKTGLVANAVPFLIDPKAGRLGTLKAHVARANEQWQAFDPDYPALVVFQGVDRYVTPSWYATKRINGKVVPTWNYVMVQVQGPLIVHDDPHWLAAQIEALTRKHETPRPAPWAVGDAPEAFVEAQIRAIVGIEIPIEAIDGKWKVSQNRTEADRVGVTAGLRAEADASAQAMANLVEAARRQT
jgi:transcriptional regulator